MNVTAAAEPSLPKTSGQRKTIKILCAASLCRDQTQEAHPASCRGEYRAKYQCKRSSLATGEAKTEGGKRCSDRLSRQACRRNHAACTTTPIARCAGHQGLHVCGLAKTKCTTANGPSPTRRH